MSEKFKLNSTKARQQERAELIHEVKDLVNVDSKAKAHVPTGSGKASGNFLSDHELAMIAAHKDQIEDGLEARNADYIINRLISHNGENELTDPVEVRNALVVGLDDLDLEDYDDEEIIQFVEDKRRELAEYKGATVAEKEVSSVEIDSSNPEITQLKAENAELRAELAEMRKTIAELTALRGDEPRIQIEEGFNVDAEAEAAKARLAETAQVRAQAAIDAIHSTDQARADKELLDSEGGRVARVTGDTFDAPAVEQTTQLSIAERMDAIRAQTGNTGSSNRGLSGSDSIATRMNEIASTSPSPSESSTGARTNGFRGISSRDWLRNPLASVGGVLVARAEARARAEQESTSRGRVGRLMAGFVLFGGAIGGGLLLMKGHDVLSHGGHSRGTKIDGLSIKDLFPGDGSSKKTGGDGSGDVLRTVRVNSGDGEIKVTQHILEQQGIHVSVADAQRIGEHANVDLLLRDSNYNDASSTLDRIGGRPGVYDIRPGSAEALVQSAKKLGLNQ